MILLDNELWNIVIGDSSISMYCTKIKTIDSFHENIDVIVLEKNSVWWYTWSYPSYAIVRSFPLAPPTSVDH